MTTIKTRAFMLKINCLELLEGRKSLPIRENTYFFKDNSLVHAVFSCTEHIYCENIT